MSNNEKKPNRLEQAAALGNFNKTLVQLMVDQYRTKPVDQEKPKQ